MLLGSSRLRLRKRTSLHARAAFAARRVARGSRRHQPANKHKKGTTIR
ncbi:hypothetical protein AKJ09_08724 [Labilithrix luteola]|uniref:Uncharacterized protein n=1 Tax=Labilithrix luteola TaxID=1391654 RepID=A0A0K1Q8C5_9BACT|nr:hypothetical protein AKJ09_08724 [Labilithrix luteola]